MRRHSLESGRYGMEGVSNGGEARLKASPQSVDVASEMNKQAEEIQAQLARIEQEDAALGLAESAQENDGPTTWDNLAERAAPFRPKTEETQTPAAKSDEEIDQKIEDLKNNLWKIFG